MLLLPTRCRIPVYDNKVLNIILSSFYVNLFNFNDLTMLVKHLKCILIICTYVHIVKYEHDHIFRFVTPLSYHLRYIGMVWSLHITLFYKQTHIIHYKVLYYNYNILTTNNTNSVYYFMRMEHVIRYSREIFIRKAVRRFYFL